jgi:thiol-disulfide isomerase/thioredoxin/YHS domain-containing protein
MLRRWSVACTLTLTVVAIGAGLALSETPSAEKTIAPSEWMSDYKSARDESRRLGLPLIVHFHTSWCGPCKQMEREFLGTSAMREALGEKFVGLKLDGDEHQWLVEGFRVTGYPCDVIVDPGGKILNSTSGRKTKSQYFQMLNQVRSEHQAALSKSRALALAELKSGSEIAATNPAAGTRREGPEAEATQTGIAGSPDVVRPPAATLPPLIGLDGYCPVAIKERRQWLRGRNDLAVTHQGVVYYLASEEEFRQFKQAPWRFVPKMLGCDPVELWDSDQAMQGSVQFGAFFDRQLYLFVTANSRTKFKRDPVKYTRARHAIQAHDVTGTRLR